MKQISTKHFFNIFLLSFITSPLLVACNGNSSSSTVTTTQNNSNEVAQNSHSTPSAPLAKAIAYLAIGYNKNQPSKTMLQMCNVEKDGSLTDCIDSGAKFDDYHASFNVLADAVAIRGKYAYISNNMDGQMVKCSIGANGLLSNCQITGSNVGYGPTWITLHNDLAYIAVQFTGQVYKCGFDKNGELVNCVDSGGTGFSNPTAIAFNANNAYITAPNHNAINICSVSNDGSLSNCSMHGDSGLGVNYNIAFNNGIAYAANGAVFVGGIACHDLVKKCTTATDGSFEKCDTVGNGNDSQGNSFYQPFAVLFNNNYAYVLNNSYLASISTLNGIKNYTSISKCQANSDGSFTNCEYIKTSTRDKDLGRNKKVHQ